MQSPRGRRVRVRSRARAHADTPPPPPVACAVRRRIQYPMMFNIRNADESLARATHCSVLEFTAEEGRCYIPHWVRVSRCLPPAPVTYRPVP